MPPDRRPLRQRCNVKLTIRTGHSSTTTTRSPSSSSWIAPSIRNTTINRTPEPSRRRHERASRLTIPRPTPFLPLPLYALSQITDNLCVAYCNFATAPRLSDNEARCLDGRWTHVLRIVPATSDEQLGKMAIDSSERWGVQTLTLPIPSRFCRAHKGMRWEMVTGLTDGQIVAARDFLALCLPSRRKVFANSVGGGEGVDEGRVQVLVTAPTENGDKPATAMDVMAVVSCYLSFVTGKGVPTILRDIRGESSYRVHRHWKKALHERWDADVVKAVDRLAPWEPQSPCL